MTNFELFTTYADSVKDNFPQKLITLSPTCSLIYSPSFFSDSPPNIITGNVDNLQNSTTYSRGYFLVKYVPPIANAINWGGR